jgi:hypothetical protein
MLRQAGPKRELLTNKINVRMLLNNTSIMDFWHWFESVSSDLLNYADDRRLIDELDVRVAQLGPFDWEIGPWDTEIYFAISPNLDPEKLVSTQKIVSLAPTLAQWHFLPSKPAKDDWEGIFNMKNQRGDDILVDSSTWKYTLYKFEDKTFDADILISGVDGDIDTRNLAVDIAMTGYLGEAYFLQTIQNVKVVDGFEYESIANATLLKDIKKHIDAATREVGHHDFIIDESLKNKAYLEGLKLMKAGYDAEVIRGRLDKMGIPEDLIAQVVRNLYIQQTVDESNREAATSNIKLNTALIRVGAGFALAVIVYLIFPGIIILPIGVIGGGIISAFMAKSKT